MKAMVLAAGRGERLRPLTDACPKPLFTVAGETLAGRLLRQLAAAGVTDVVMNVSWLADQLQEAVGDGSAYGVQVKYSDEREGRLDTGGGILQALPQLGDTPFIVANADVVTDVDFEALVARARRLPPDMLAHAVLVPNPDHNPGGDFGLTASGAVHNGHPRHTFAGVSIQTPALYAGCGPGAFSVVPLLRAAAMHGRLSGELHAGLWNDVGTVERLRAVRRQFGDDTPV